MRRRALDPQRREGVSLLEIMVAVSLLAFASGPLAVFIVHTAQRANGLSAMTYRNAVMAQEASRLSVLPYDSLVNRAGCVTEPAAPYPYARCIGLDSVGPQVRRVTVIVRLANPAFRPDTVQLERVRPPGNNPLNTS